MSNMTRTFDLLESLSIRPKDAVVFSSICNGQWRDYTILEYKTYADACSFALMGQGVRKGEAVISITHNRAEFNFVDMGIAQIGAVHVPVYPAIDVVKLESIIKETRARIAFISNRSVLRKIEQIKSCPLHKVISFDRTEGVVAFEDFIQSGKGSQKELQQLKDAVKPTDPASITYLSGSNTPLRGVVLSHQAHVFNMEGYCDSNHVAGCTQSISFLPLAHSFERTLNYSFQLLGIKINYCEGIASLGGVLKQKNPDVMMVVPLVLDRMIEIFRNEAIKMAGIKGWLAIQALNLAANLKPNESSYWFSFRRYFIRKSLSGFRNMFGGKMKVVLCGGAALRPAAINTLWAAGVNVFEGYGLTEAGPLVAYNIKDGSHKYDVGRPMQGVEVKIGDDGEVLVKSPGLMLGYLGYAEVPIDAEGWLHTGDIGQIDKDGALKLTGIKKEIFKLSSGLYTDPRPIEAALTVLDCIENAWVYGHNRAYLVALISIRNVKTEQATEDPTDKIEEKIGQQIAHYNASCPKYDQIIRYRIMNEKWTISNGLLTKNGDMDRQVLLLKYAAIIEELYSF